MLPRAFAPDLDPAQGRVRLSADESAHLTRVLRLRMGARLLIFDGRGTQYQGELATIGKQGAEITLLEPAAAAAEPRVRLTLAQAVLKGDKMDAVVRDATMMGVTAILPAVTDRTIVPLSAVEQGRAIERWHRVAVASAKQCGRAVVPEIAAPVRLVTLLTDARARAAGLRVQLVEPSASDGAGDLPDEPPADVLIGIGPEGGWSSEEVTRARAAGWHPWTLGGRTLRAESAPLAALAALTYAWKL